MQKSAGSVVCHIPALFCQKLCAICTYKKWLFLLDKFAFVCYNNQAFVDVLWRDDEDYHKKL